MHISLNYFVFVCTEKSPGISEVASRVTTYLEDNSKVLEFNCKGRWKILI